jgi:O-antigen/teichoic acid export membrane protein
MSLKELFFKDTIIYGLTSYLSLAAAFFLTPIYTRILSKADYGIMDLFNTWNNFFLLILPLGLTSAILRLYSDFKDDELTKRKYLGTLFLTILGSYTIYILIMIFFISPIRSFYFREGFVYSLYWISLLIIPLQILTDYFQSLNRIEFKKYIYLAINLTNFALLTGLGVMLVYFNEMGVMGFFIASLVATTLSFLIALYNSYEKIYLSFDFKIFKSAIKYSIYLLLVIVFLRFTYIVDRTLINSFFSIKEVGEYSIAMRLGNIMDIFIGGFTTAWFPYALSLMNAENRNDVYQKAFKYYLIIFTSIAFIICLFVKELLLFLAPSYLSVEPIAYMIIANSVIAGTAHFFGLGIHIAKKSYFFILSASISFTVNVLFSYLLVQQIGMFGIVLGSILAILTWTLVDHFISYKLESIFFKLNQLFLSVFLLILASSGIYYFNKLEISFLFQVIVKIFISLIFVSILIIWEKKNVIILIEEIKGRLR